MRRREEHHLALPSGRGATRPDGANRGVGVGAEGADAARVGRARQRVQHPHRVELEDVRLRLEHHQQLLLIHLHLEDGRRKGELEDGRLRAGVPQAEAVLAKTQSGV